MFISIRLVDSEMKNSYYHQRCEIEPRTGEVYSVQHYVIKFVSDLRQVGGFLWLLRFPAPIKLKYCWKWCYKNINQSNQPTNHLVNNTNKEWMEDQNVKKKIAYHQHETKKQNNITRSKHWNTETVNRCSVKTFFSCAVCATHFALQGQHKCFMCKHGPMDGWLR
jgi:hypothetical protein